MTVSIYNRETGEHKFFNCCTVDFSISIKGTPQIVMYALDGETFKNGSEILFRDINLDVESVSAYNPEDYE
jgi:hypothetical protein